VSAVRPTQSPRGQATVELALVLPLVALLLAAVAQVVLLARDELRVVQAARVAARAVVVHPDEGAARAAIRGSGMALDGMRVSVTGSRAPAGLAAVTVSARPTRVPLVGLVVSGVELRERFVVRVE